MKHIRPWEYSDCESLAKTLNNEKILANLRDGIPFPYTVLDAERFIDSTLNAPEGSQYSWAIQNEAGEAIGSIGIFRCANIHFRTAEMGYYIAEDYWGKGIVTAAVKEACAFVFENTDIIRIFAEPFSTNIGSRRVLEKAGFKLEGILEKNACKNGEILDMCMYALVK